MSCPQCNSWNIACIDSRPLEDGHRRRRYKCQGCGFRWNTMEIPEKQYKDLQAVVSEYKVLEHLRTLLNQLIKERKRLSATSKNNEV